MLAVNPVVALWMKQDAVVCTRGTTHHAGGAIMKTPSRDPGDLCVAYVAEPTLEIPEKAKRSSTPKRCRHIISFAFLEVGCTRRIVLSGQRRHYRHIREWHDAIRDRGSTFSFHPQGFIGRYSSSVSKIDHFFLCGLSHH